LTVLFVNRFIQYMQGIRWRPQYRSLQWLPSVRVSGARCARPVVAAADGDPHSSVGTPRSRLLLALYWLTMIGRTLPQCDNAI
jgi:hypothetical protein